MRKSNITYFVYNRGNIALCRKRYLFGLSYRNNLITNAKGSIMKFEDQYGGDVKNTCMMSCREFKDNFVT